MQKSKLEIINLSKQVGRNKILENLNYRFVSGNIHLLNGENGAGKSTFLDIVSGLNSNFTGKIIGNLGIKTQQNPYIFLEQTVFDSLSICNKQEPGANNFKNKFINIYFDYFKIKNKPTIQQLELLNYFELSDILHKKIKHLSFGQKKLLDIIRILSIDTDIYIFDESFSGLSTTNVQKLKQLILNLKENNKIIILVEHNNPITEIVDEILNLENGKINSQKN